MTSLFPNASSIVEPILRNRIRAPPAAWQTYGIGLIIVTITAFAAPAGLLLIPLFNKNAYEHIMSLLVALGIGALSGSIIFIMIPRALDINHEPKYVIKPLITLIALYCFFFIDRILQYLIEMRRRGKIRKIHAKTLDMLAMHQKDRTHSIITIPELIENEETARDIEGLKADIELTDISNAVARRLSTRRRLSVLKRIELEKNPAPEKGINVSVRVVDKAIVHREDLEVASVVYMIIFGSSANNFIDGMSNGVAFGKSLFRGLSIGIACIAQQFPQELGMLAILTKTGLGMKRTLLLNLIPGFLSYFGFMIGATLGRSFDRSDQFVFAVSSGMYLYVLLGTLIPEMRESTNELIKEDIKKSLIATLEQIIGLVVGVLFMLFMALYGEFIHV